MLYVNEIDVGDARVRDLPEIVEAAREYGDPELDGFVLTVRWDVGPDGSAEDLWDLRDCVGELASKLSGFGIDWVGVKPVAWVQS